MLYRTSNITRCRPGPPHPLWGELGAVGLALVLGLQGCSEGEVGGQAGQMSLPTAGTLGAAGAAGSLAGTGAGVSAAGTGAAGTAAADDCTRKPIEPRAVMMTPEQFRNTLRDLLGPDVLPPEGPAVEFEIVDRPWVTTGSLGALLRDAEAATESLRGETGALLGCASLTDAACVRTGLSSIARRAFKRSPEAAELDALMAIHSEGLAAISDGGETATLAALQALLISPSTLYRTEFMGTNDGVTQVLNAHERAAAVAAFLLDSVPDEALLAAAEDGSLATDAGLRAQVDRLLGLERVQTHLANLILDGYRAARVFETPKDDALFPSYTPQLMTSMYEESRLFVTDILARNAPVSDLLLSQSTFVDPALAELYGVAHPTGQDEFAQVQLPSSRAGLLTQPSLMSVLSRTDKTSVVARGLFVRGALLCLPKVPSPPDSVQAQVAEQLGADATQAELAAYRAMTLPCANCHSQFDRFGLVLEGFDPIGRERTEPVDPVDLKGLYVLEGTVGTAGELVSVLVENSRFTRCLSERMLDYALTMALGGDAFCDADALHQAVSQSDGSMASVISAVVSHPAFASRSLGGP